MTKFCNPCPYPDTCSWHRRCVFGVAPSDALHTPKRGDALKHKWKDGRCIRCGSPSTRIIDIPCRAPSDDQHTPTDEQRLLREFENAIARWGVGLSRDQLRACANAALQVHLKEPSR